MDDFELFYNELLNLVKKFERRQLPIKIQKDLDDGIIKIFADTASALSRAKHGLTDIQELSLATAEHHPYWNLLNNSSEIVATVLDKWTDDLSDEDLSEIDWSLKELFNTIEKIKK